MSVIEKRQNGKLKSLTVEPKSGGSGYEIRLEFREFRLDILGFSNSKCPDLLLETFNQQNHRMKRLLTDLAIRNKHEPIITDTKISWGDCNLYYTNLTENQCFEEREKERIEWKRKCQNRRKRKSS